MFPQISIKHDFDQLTKWAKSVAAEQVPFAAALTLTMTGQDVKTAIELDLATMLDRPTPYTMRGFRLYPAKKTNLVAKVTFREDARDYLGAQVEGGERKVKALEKALRTVGHLPTGWVVVPGQGARLDQYGNLDRGQIIQILSQLRITLVAGYTRNLSFNARKQIGAQRRAGGRFFVVKPGGPIHPGVYQRELFGRGITPVLMFVRTAAYKVRLPVDQIGRRVVADRLETNFGIAWHRAMASARKTN
jgi:hypothetical protein